DLRPGGHREIEAFGMECSYFCRLGVQSDASRPNRVGEGKSDRQHCNTCGDQAGINSNQAFDAATYGFFFSASAHPALSLSHAKEHRTEQLRQESAGLFSNSVTKLNERCGRGCLTTSEPTVGPTHFGSRGLKSRCAWPCCDVLRGGRTPFLNERGLLTPRATSGYSSLVRAHSVSGGSVCAAPTSTLALRCRRFYYHCIINSVSGCTESGEGSTAVPAGSLQSRRPACIGWWRLSLGRGAEAGQGAPRGR